MQLLSAVVLQGGSMIDLDGTFFVQLLLFFIAFLFLRAFVFHPMIRLFERREEAIDGARAEAKKMEKEAGQKAATFEEEMRKIRLQAGAERERLRQDGIRLERKLLEKVRTETQQTLREAEQKLQGEARNLRSEIRAKVPALGREIAARLLDREVS